jgi:tRNA pseudouridine55 synthase
MTRRRDDAIDGWVALDKPAGLSSTRALARVKRLLGAEKAGHGGTLDPLASGLLPIALGEATKTVSYAMAGRKIYRFEVTWGEERSTDDLEGTIIRQSALRPSPDDIATTLGEFTGEIMQVPPAYSAIKVAGERAYDIARAGAAVELMARPVTIEALRFLGVDGPDRASFEVTCGKGTYIRSLARDMGRRLGTLGHVSFLRRIAVGAFGEGHMIPLEMLEEFSHKAPGDFAKEGVLFPIETVLDGIPALAIDGDQAQRLRQGQQVLLRGASAPIAHEAVLVTSGGKPLGIAAIERGTLIPKRLFNL